ncbi:sensor histidine kinase [Caproiciproducens faecalis]|uniref:GHKL domain-containing protein n=1 Tax=Caproiciproducens faecalis TaxID=2820301 RepID=A0ABS7DKX8_9FIRM|nr:sensor histidine kinase [Caproiciproducens faecalis]MBW7571959.1 GHKL domain-containing protein [Caproiciproducens faecalis]
MMKSRHTKAYLILGLIFVILFTHLPVVYTLFYHNLTGAPTAENGNINGTMLSSSQTIVLDGSWEFYWNRLIATEPQQGVKPDFLIKVPDYWSKYKINGSWLPADGFASYRLTLRRLDYSHPVTVYIPDFGSAYRVFIDGILTTESGIVSKNTEKIFTVPQAKLSPVTLSAGKAHEVVIEVASTRFSGLYMAPVLKDYNSTVGENNNRDSIRLILFGTVLSFLIILIVLYGLSFRKNIHSPWFPAMGFLVILRIMLTTEFYSFWQKTVFFNLSYETANQLMFFVTFVLKFLFIFLVQEQFQITFSRKEKVFFSLYYTVIYLAYFFIPHAIYNRYLTVLLPVSTFALEGYSFFKVYFSRHQLKKFGLLIYGGVILAISGLIIDCYYINGNIYFNMSLTLLIMFSAYLMILSLVYALRIADLYNDFAVSSSLLARAENQIAMQKEYFGILSGQINEIRGIKHDLRHFISVMERLSEEGRIDELNRFLGEYAKQTETDSLPVFCENVVANSILGYYSLKAKRENIPFRCACSIQKQLFVSDSDLCVVLGNALENAIEACEKLLNSDARFMSVEVRTINGQLLFKVENSFNGCLKMKDDSYLSTKNGEFHGIGMRNIKKVVESYKGFVKAENDGKVFSLMAAFPNPCNADEV